MKGSGVLYLNELMKSIIKQTYKNYEIVIADQSADDNILNYLKSNFTGTGIKINYTKHNYKKGSSSANTNMAMKQARGDIIKIMFQDDMFCDNTCLEKIVNAYTTYNMPLWGGVGFNHISTHNELFTGTKHKPQYPIYNEHILQGRNTFGCPSTLYFKNDLNLFDENLIWLMDCDFLYNLHKKYGPPNIICEYLVSVRIWENSVSSAVRTDESITKPELEYVLKKFPEYVYKEFPQDE